MISRIFTKTFSLLAAFCSLCLMAGAQTVRVAIAANLQPVMQALQNDFKAQTGLTIQVISGASGNLSTQIRNGAPYDVFMSADVAFAGDLQRDGFAMKPAEVYAQGVLIICSNQTVDLARWPELLTTGRIEKIAIANPAIAPYGKAAQQALAKANIYEKLKDKIVFGESITQVNTYITTGVVQAGFTTLSLVKGEGGKSNLFYSIVNPRVYQPIYQAILLLKHAKGNTWAEKFYHYILSPAAKTIFKRYGYQVK